MSRLLAIRLLAIRVLEVAFLGVAFLGAGRSVVVAGEGEVGAWRWLVVTVDGVEAERAELAEPAADGCWSGVGVGEVATTWDTRDASAAIDLSLASWPPSPTGARTIEVWLEDESGARSARVRRLVCGEPSPPAAVAGVEFAVDDGPWAELEGLEEREAECRGVSELAGLLDIDAIDAGTRRLGVRLVSDAGEELAARWTSFVVDRAARPGPLTLRPDLPGELADNFIDDDGDGLIDGEDPEVGALDLGPHVLLVLEDECEAGEWVYASERAVDGAEYFPEPGSPRAGEAWLVLPEPAPLDLSARARVELDEALPELAELDYDAGERRLRVCVADPVLDGARGLSVRLDRPNVEACALLAPAAIEAAVDREGCAELEPPAAGPWVVRVVARRGARVAHRSQPEILAVPAFCVDGLTVTAECDGEEPQVRLRWDEFCELTGEVVVLRDGAELARLVPGVGEHLDTEPGLGAEHAYQVRVVGRSPVPGPSASATVRATAPPCVGGERLPSDCNGDRRLDLSDAVCVFGFLFLGGPTRLPCGEGGLESPANVRLLDGNGDGRVDLSDGVYVLNYLFAGGPPAVLGVTCVAIEGCTAACD